MDAYSFETLRFDNPTLRSVTTSYLITMVGSKRRESYMRQLETHRPTGKVVVVHNKGYRRCRKKGVRSAAQDLWHANQTIASLCEAREGGEAVLILEDDVEFTPHFSEMASEIDRFMKENEHAEIAYALGVQGFFSVPIDTSHVRILSGGFTHAVIYSSPALSRFKETGIPTWGLHDIVIFSKLYTYAPRFVCAVQAYERTENAAVWDALCIHHTLFEACDRSPVKHFSLLHQFNWMGGTGVIVLILVGLVVALPRTYMDRAIRNILTSSSDRGRGS